MGIFDTRHKTAKVLGNVVQNRLQNRAKMTIIPGPRPDPLRARRNPQPASLRAPRVRAGPTGRDPCRRQNMTRARQSPDDRIRFSSTYYICLNIEGI